MGIKIKTIKMHTEITGLQAYGFKLMDMIRRKLNPLGLSLNDVVCIEKEGGKWVVKLEKA